MVASCVCDAIEEGKQAVRVLSDNLLEQALLWFSSWFNKIKHFYGG
jgi:hypothetical protein